jgi:hypothetical protein
LAQSGAMNLSGRPAHGHSRRDCCAGWMSRAPLHLLPHGRPLRRGLRPDRVPAGAAPARPGRRGGRADAAVAVRAHAVLRVGLLLLRLQQGHHQAPRPGGEYLDALDQEIALHAGAGRGNRCRSCTSAAARPPSWSDAELAPDGHAAAAFRIVPGAEVSIEVDPRTASPGAAARLAAMGFNRISFGVQDFDPTCSRPCTACSPESVRDLVLAARALASSRSTPT